MRRTKGIAALAAAAAAAAALPAAAAEAATEAASCTVPALSQPYAGFGDRRQYTLAPGGSFEAGDTPWAFTGGARIVAGNERWYLRSASDRSSLQLAPGASATSPAMCVTLAFPTFRLPVRSLDPNGQSDLVIEVRYPNGADTSWKGVRTESGKAAQGWRLTSDIDLKPDTYGSSNAWRHVHLRFSVKGKPTDPGWQIDDVYVDPRFRR